jgi:hypothetical protein
MLKRLCATLWIIYRGIGRDIWNIAHGQEQTDFYEDGFCLACGTHLPWCWCDDAGDASEEVKP